MAELIGRGLAKEGMAVDIASTGEQAIEMAGAADYDSIVLDVLLPGIDGFETCRRLREQGTWAPVLLLTARDGVEDRVAGLDGGADLAPRRALRARRSDREGTVVERQRDYVVESFQRSHGREWPRVRRDVRRHAVLLRCGSADREQVGK